MKMTLNPASRDLKNLENDERYTRYQKPFPADAVSELDPRGNTEGIEDVFTKLGHARRHYEQIGLGADYVKRFIH